VLTEAADSEGFRRVPRQQRPVVMNTKGPSASGKSTLRPLQRSLAGRIGVDWAEFALISPDIWRKQLIDYGSLGDAYKYAAAFTGEELAIVDHKLDRYMARKAAHGGMTHLLIDRFRFDSFAPDSNEAGSNLLTRFGQIVYLFFVITPPASLVERAWQRGLELGRYKAVDDVLAHGVEAYAGMPGLFFTWTNRPDKRVRFESRRGVAQGERPRTVAFGWNDTHQCPRCSPHARRRALPARRHRCARSESLYPAPAPLDPRRMWHFSSNACAGSAKSISRPRRADRSTHASNRAASRRLIPRRFPRRQATPTHAPAWPRQCRGYSTRRHQGPRRP
jgi:hypothetical protein